MTNRVYIATSLDGFIADKDEGLDWLHSVPNPHSADFGWGEFLDDTDALVMGRRTYEKLRLLSEQWPHDKPTFVLSQTLQELPDELEGKVELIRGNPAEVTATLHERGYQSLYIDGGQTIQRFLRNDLIDELTVTTLPILLGGGVRLFGDLPEPLDFYLHNTAVFLDAIVQSRYVRNRD